MNTIIHDLTSNAGSIIALLAACIVIVRKLKTLVKDVRKMFAPAKPGTKSQRAISALVIHADTRSKRKELVVFGSTLLVLALMLSWDLSAPGLPSRMEVAGIAFKIGCLFAMIFVEYLSRFVDIFAQSQGQFAESQGQFAESVYDFAVATSLSLKASKEAEPSSPEPTAPSGRGSS